MVEVEVVEKGARGGDGRGAGGDVGVAAAVGMVLSAHSARPKLWIGPMLMPWITAKAYSSARVLRPKERLGAMPISPTTATRKYLREEAAASQVEEEEVVVVQEVEEVVVEEVVEEVVVVEEEEAEEERAPQREKDVGQRIEAR